MKALFASTALYSSSPILPPGSLPRPASHGCQPYDQLRIDRLTVSKILNHAEKGVTAVYDRHSYDQEKREALQKWGQQLAAIVTGKPRLVHSAGAERLIA